MIPRFEFHVKYDLHNPVTTFSPGVGPHVGLWSYSTGGRRVRIRAGDPEAYDIDGSLINSWWSLISIGSAAGDCLGGALPGTRRGARRG